MTPQQFRGTVVVVGNLTIDDVVAPDGTTRMATLGGNSVHAATAAVVNGAPTAIVARRGDDFPDSAIRRLAEAGVDVSYLRPVPGPTVRNWVVHESDGRRHRFYRTPTERSREVAPRPEDLPVGLLRGATVVHVAAMPLANAEAVVLRIRAANPNAVITLDPHEDWVAGYRDRVLALAARVDVFVPSVEELVALTGAGEVLAGCSDLAAHGVQTAVVKAGADGAYVLEAGRVQHVGTRTVTVADATGAGDAFCGALAAGLGLDLPLVAAVRLGCATAAAAVGGSGGLRLLDAAPGRAMLRADADSLRAVTLTDCGAPHKPVDRAGAAPMRQEILTIPEVITEVLLDRLGAIEALAEQLRRDRIEHVWLTGCGDSAFAAEAAALAFQRHSGLTPHALHAVDLSRYQARYLPTRSAVIALSVSGSVGRTTEAAIQARRFGHLVIALTNDPRGQLAAAGDQVLPIDIPTLGYAPGTATYVGMLATLLRLAAALGAVGGRGSLLDGLRRIPDLAARTLLDADGPAERAAATMLPASWVAFLGSGPSHASARFGAARLFEAPQRVGVSTNVEEWAHEEYFVTAAGDPVVLVAPSGASHDRAMEILAELLFIEARPVVVSDVYPGPGALHVPVAAGANEELSPLLTCLPLALVGFHLSRLSGRGSYAFPTERARAEHYRTIHRATVGEPA